MTSAAATLTEHSFDTPQALAPALAGVIAQRLREAIVAQGRASLIVAGGTTPKATLERLAHESLAWNEVSVSLADERWVAPGDPASNETMVREALLHADAARAHFVGLYTGDPSPEAGEQACAARLATLARPFDVVLLGMGEDGHMASLFPGSPALAAALDPDGPALCRAVRAPQVQPPRMTLTLRALLETRALFLLIQGEGKRRVYETARGEGPIEAMPIRAVLRQQRVPVQLYWSRSA